MEDDINYTVIYDSLIDSCDGNLIERSEHNTCCSSHPIVGEKLEIIDGFPRYPVFVPLELAVPDR
jgi:hypothetical protein